MGDLLGLIEFSYSDGALWRRGIAWVFIKESWESGRSLDKKYNVLTIAGTELSAHPEDLPPGYKALEYSFELRVREWECSLVQVNRLWTIMPDNGWWKVWIEGGYFTVRGSGGSKGKLQWDVRHLGAGDSAVRDVIGGGSLWF